MRESSSQHFAPIEAQSLPHRALEVCKYNGQLSKFTEAARVSSAPRLQCCGTSNTAKLLYQHGYKLQVATYHPHQQGEKLMANKITKRAKLARTV